MREDMRRRLREFAEAPSTNETRVTRVTGVTAPGSHTPSHAGVTPPATEKTQSYQCVTPVTRVTPAELEGSIIRHTSGGVTNDLAKRVTVGGGDPEDWLAFYDERAGILEFDGGLDRADAERRALIATVAALGPRPRVH